MISDMKLFKWSMSSRWYRGTSRDNVHVVVAVASAFMIEMLLIEGTVEPGDGYIHKWSSMGPFSVVFESHSLHKF